MPEAPKLKCLTYCPLPYNGRGWTETCANMLTGFSSAGVTPLIVLPRATRALPRSINVLESLPFPLSRLPWKFVQSVGVARLDDLFKRQVSSADPKTTVAYFWPGTPLALVKETKNAGILAVRQMINTFQGTAKRILDRAYGELSLPGPISQSAVDCEIEELNLYDYIFSPGAGVDQSLQEAGVPTRRIIPTSFGWSPSRFKSTSPPREAPGPPRFLFVGTACVRKGIPVLLDAWKKAAVSGELVIVGHVEPSIQGMMAEAIREGSVRHVPFTDDLEALYRSADVFVLPTLEEGGVQVTLEAGGCGLPVITTTMGAARLVKHDINGLIVDAGNVDALTAAFQRLAGNGALRREFSKRIEQDASLLTYDKVSHLHGRLIAELLRKPPAAGGI